MTRDECKRQAVLMAGGGSVRQAEAAAVAERWLARYDQRDQTIDPGVVLVDEIDPETRGHRTVERQIHPPRRVAPFAFGPAEVQALAREIRRELRLK